MPEDEPPQGVQGGSLDLALFMTLTVAIYYQRNADACGKLSKEVCQRRDQIRVRSSRGTSAEPKRVRADLSKYAVSKKTEERLQYLAGRRDHVPQEWREIPVPWGTTAGTRSPFSSVLALIPVS